VVVPSIRGIAVCRHGSAWSAASPRLLCRVDGGMLIPTGRWWSAARLRKEVFALPPNKKLQLTIALPRCARAGACS
jgi:hypothetical protein